MQTPFYIFGEFTQLPHPVSAAAYPPGHSPEAIKTPETFPGGYFKSNDDYYKFAQKNNRHDGRLVLNYSYP